MALINLSVANSSSSYTILFILNRTILESTPSASGMDTITITKHIETHDTIFIKKETENIQKEAKRQTVSPYKYIIALTALVVILLAVAVRRYFK